MLRSVVRASALSFVFVTTSPLWAQAGRPPAGPESSVLAQVAALDKLSFMLGTWKGSGWIMLGLGKRADFTQTETVTRKLDGALVTIDGDGRDAANPERHIHSAFATVTYSPETGKYRFMPFSAGHMLDVEPTVSEHTFVWGFDAPYGRTRFTLNFADGSWHETGELSRDGGATWNKNFEMTLSKGS